MIYNCHRTATVVSDKYCTVASLKHSKFIDVTIKWPELVKELKEQIYVYDDDIKAFLETQLEKVDYLQKADMDTFHEVLFNFKQESFDAGSYIFKE